MLYRHIDTNVNTYKLEVLVIQGSNKNASTNNENTICQQNIGETLEFLGSMYRYCVQVNMPGQKEMF